MGVGARGVGGCQAPAAVLLKYGETTHEVSEVVFHGHGPCLLSDGMARWRDAETRRRGGSYVRDVRGERYSRVT